MKTANRIRSFKAHQGRINHCEISPNEKFFITCGNDKKVGIWSLQNGIRGDIDVRMINAHPAGSVLHSQISSKSNWFVTTSSLIINF